MNIADLKQLCLDQADRNRNDAHSVLAYSKAYNQLVQAEVHERVISSDKGHPPEQFPAPPVALLTEKRSPVVRKV